MNEAKRSRLHRIFGSIRSKFLLFFISAMAVILIFATLFAYNRINDTIVKTNERNARAEIKQISTNLNALYMDLARQTDSIMSSSFMRVIGEYGLHTDLELVYAIKDFYSSARMVFMNFPYIQSVYIFLNGNYVLCATNENMQQFKKVDMDEYGEARDKIISLTSRNITFIGGMRPKQFPFLFSQEKYMAESERNLVSAVRNTKDYTIVLNIYEEQLQSSYAGVSDKSSYSVRILGSDGSIISSGEPTESGMPYEHFSIINEKPAGQYTNTDNGSQLIWEAIPNANVIIATEVLLQEYFSELKGISMTFLQIIIPGFILMCILFYLWLGKAFKPLIFLMHSMKRTGQGYSDELLPVTGNDELSILIMNYNDMLQNIKNLNEKNKAIEQEKRESELKALRNQINPHFLLNTLSNIKWMCLIGGNNDAAECVTLLSRIISPMIRSNTQFCSLQKELELVQLYIKIMNLRMDNGITYECSVDETLLDVQILRFIIQPIIENAITHGFENTTGKGVISLQAYQLDNKLTIVVTDNGKGMSDEGIDRINNDMRNNTDSNGIGLMNTNRRLKLQYGQDYGVHIRHGSPCGLMVTLVMPLDDQTDSLGT